MEIFQCQVNFSLVGDCKKMQHRVGRTTQCHQDCDGVFKSFLGQDVASSNSLGNQIHYCSARLLGKFIAPAIYCRRGRRSWKCKANCLGNTCHGVGGKHSTTSSLTRTDGLFNLVYPILGNQPTSTGTYCFKGIDNRDIFSINLTRKSGTGINKD